MVACKRFLSRCVLVLLSAVVFIPSASSAEILEPGAVFPDLTSSQKLPGHDRQYLGLPTGMFSLFKNRDFSIHKIKADAIVLAFFNRYCPACKKQASVLNKAYAHFMGKGDLRSSVKFIAIGSGNSLMEVQRFKS